MGDNLEHLQDNMCLTMHINSTSTQLTQIEEQLGQVGAVVLGIARGALEGPGTGIWLQNLQYSWCEHPMFTNVSTNNTGIL